MWHRLLFAYRLRCQKRAIFRWFVRDLKKTRYLSANRPYSTTTVQRLKSIRADDKHAFITAQTWRSRLWGSSYLVSTCLCPIPVISIRFEAEGKTSLAYYDNVWWQRGEVFRQKRVLPWHPRLDVPSIIDVYDFFCLAFVCFRNCRVFVFVPISIRRSRPYSSTGGDAYPITCPHENREFLVHSKWSDKIPP